MLFVRSLFQLTMLMVLILFNGCSVSHLIEGGNLSEESQAKEPIILSLSQGYFADTSMYLRVQLEVLDRLATDSVFIQLCAFKDDQLIEEQTIPIKNFIQTSILDVGSRVLVPFTLGISEVDRFTIACSWGEAGYTLAAQLDLVDHGETKSSTSPQDLENPIKISELEITEEQIPCSEELCFIRVNLQGRIFNSVPDYNIKAIALAYRLLWVPDGEIPSIKINSAELTNEEKLLSFGEGRIPDEGFEFEVLGDKDLPKIPGGKFMPVVRVLKFKIEK